MFTLLLAFSTGVAADDSAATGVCAPFQNGKIESSVLERMMQAADEGYLYRIQEGQSRVGFCVNSAIGRIEGEFQRFKGGFTVSVDPNEQAVILIDTGSVEAPGIFFEKMIRGEMFLDSKNYPEMLFVSTGFFWVDEYEAVLIGELTIRGVTRKVGLHVEISSEEVEPGGMDGETLKVKASTRIRRSEFGILSLSPMLNDEIDLCMTVAAVRFRDVH